MALAGLTEVQVNYFLTLSFAWEVQEQSIANNSSTVKWRLCLLSTGEDYISKVTKQPYRVTIGNSTFTGTSDINMSTSTDFKVLASGSTIIKHDYDGTKTFSYTFKQEFNLSPFENGGTISERSGSGTGELDKIDRRATIITAPDFTDEDNPTIIYYNPAGEYVSSLQACISLTGETDDIAYREIAQDIDGSYTFELAEEDRELLRNATTTSNTRTIKFYIKTKIAGAEYLSSVTKTLTIINGEPTLAPIVTDINERTRELTGGSAIVRYHSNILFITGAAARKGATIEYQNIICGSKSLEDYTSNQGTLEQVDSNTIYFSVTDSRGNTTRDAVVKSFIPYVPLTCSLQAGELTANGELTFTVSGKYFGGSFGAQDNTMELEYSVVDSNGDFVFNNGDDQSGWVKLGIVKPTVFGEDYEYSHTITGLDYTEKYTVTVNVIDALTPLQSSTKVIASIPVFDWSGEDFRHHTDVYLDNAKKIYSYYEDGTEAEVLALDSNGDLAIGRGGYENDIGKTILYGGDIDIHAYEKITINDKPLADYVIEQMSNGRWFYRKWNSGRVELYGYQNIYSLACNTALGGWYRTAVQTMQSFPFTVYNPKTVVSYESDGYGALVWLTTQATEEKPSDYYLIRPTSSTGISGKVYFYVTGTYE